MTTSSPYPPIAEHGLIGDLQTTALVDTDGTVDFFCCPRVDSPTVFGALLDHEEGGRFSVRRRADDVVTKQMYLPDTAVLVTRYLAESGVAELADFMPIEQPGVATDRRRLVRVIRGVRGTLAFDVRVEPRFDYGRQSHLTKVDGDHALFSTDDLVLDLSATVALDDDDGDVTAEVTVGEGELRVLRARVGRRRRPRRRSATATSCGSSTTPGLLARLGGARHVPGSLAGDGLPVGHHAQAPDLLAGRFDRGRVDRRAARTGRRRAELGLPLHVGPRRLVLGPRPARAGLPRRGGRVLAVDAGSGRGEARGRLAAARHHVPGRWQLGPRRGDPRPLRRLSGLTPGADRQRRRGPAPARHLRRVPRLRAPARRGRTHDRRCRVDRRRRDHRLAVRELGPARRGHLGDTGRPASRSCTGG